MLEQGRGGRSHPILTKRQVKPHTFDLVLPLHQKCVERLESYCRSQRCRCGSFWFQLHTFQLLHQSVHKGWNLIAEATGVVAVLSGLNHILFDSSKPSINVHFLALTPYFSTLP